MREVTPGLEDAIHFFFKPYSGKAVSVSFIVGIYLKELVDLIDEFTAVRRNFYHNVSCSTAPASGTLTVSVG